jgi:GR25 family glycosyltransferase involved in LPS biosynthesis
MMINDIEVIVISLKDALDRRNKIFNLLESKGVKFNFFDAIEGSLFSDNGNLHKNAIACFESHREVIKIVSKSDKTFLVLEDDATTSIDDIYNYIEGLIKTELYWDSIILGWKTFKNSNIVELNKDFLNIDRFILLHSYIINRKGAKNILRYLGDSNNHVDIRLSYLNRYKYIKLIFVKDKIFFQNNSKSQIPKIIYKL